MTVRQVEGLLLHAKTRPSTSLSSTRKSNGGRVERTTDCEMLMKRFVRRRRGGKRATQLGSIRKQKGKVAQIILQLLAAKWVECGMHFLAVSPLYRVTMHNFSQKIWADPTAAH